MADAARSFGYGEIRIPIFEHTGVFARAIGEETDIVGKEMYTFVDRGGDSMTLRPEFTAGVIRAAAQHSILGQSPLHRFWYCGPLFRYERPQKGRFRQFHQFGAECIGADSPESDAEIILLARQCLIAAGINGFRLQINTLGNSESRAAYRARLSDFLQSVAERLSDESRRRMERNPLRVLDSKDERDREALVNAPSLTDFLDLESKVHFELVLKILDSQGIPYEIHSRLVRGLDYYSHTVFEFIGDSLGSQDALGGGGRYNNMFEYFGAKSAPAVGFSLGMERIMLTLEQQSPVLYSPERPDVSLIALGEESVNTVWKYADVLRAEGLSVITDVLGRSMKSLMKEADKFSIPVVLIVGENELAAGTVILRDMRNGGQRECPSNKIVAAIREIIG
jgi:histidyl-tRNA synthetase